MSFSGTETVAPNSSDTSSTSQVNPLKLSMFQKEMDSQQSLFGGLIAGLVAAVIGASIWAAITALTEFQIGWMAVGVGFLVGFAVKKFGRGLTATYQVMGAILALLGCVLGNLMTVSWFAAPEFGIPFIEMLLVVLTIPEVAVEILMLTFSPIDLLFYGLAIVQGYKLSLRSITDEEMAQLID